MIHNVLSKHELFFNGTLGNWKTKPVDLELQLCARTFHAKPHPVPR